MPCFSCTARQTDPIKGASPWARAVVSGEQVLVCPTCQQASGWTAGLDHCARCGSYRLVKALGAIACRSCGLETWPGPVGEGRDPAGVGAADPGPPHADAGSAAGGLDGPGGLDAHGAPGVGPACRDTPTGTVVAETGPGPDLASEVAAALDRVLRRATL